MGSHCWMQKWTHLVVLTFRFTTRCIIDASLMVLHDLPTVRHSGFTRIGSPAGKLMSNDVFRSCCASRYGSECHRRASHEFLQWSSFRCRAESCKAKPAYRGTGNAPALVP